MSNAWVRDVWEGKGVRGKILKLIFSPVALLYRSVVLVRNTLFNLGWTRATDLTRPVVSVGNLTVGGTGKTPTCLWLAQELKARGLKVAILSRGYRRQGRGPVVLIPNSKQAFPSDCDEEILQAGDEPVMMTRLYGHIVAVDANRSLAATALLERENVDVFILDDGFQHRRVKRQYDLLLLGSDSSGRLLPAGPFREPKRNSSRASGLLVTGDEDQWRAQLRGRDERESFLGSLQPVFLIGYGANRWKEFPLTLLYRSKVLVVTGIGDPHGLYQMIHEWEGELVDTLEFPDHYIYSARDWQQINRVARLADLIITTEKDILKLARFPFAKDKLLALRVAMTVEKGDALIDAILQKVQPAREPI